MTSFAGLLYPETYVYKMQRKHKTSVTEPPLPFALLEVCLLDSLYTVP